MKHYIKKRAPTKIHGFDESCGAPKSPAPHRAPDRFPPVAALVARSRAVVERERSGSEVAREPRSGRQAFDDTWAGGRPVR